VRKAYKFPAVGTSAEVESGGEKKRRAKGGNGSSSLPAGKKEDIKAGTDNERKELEIAALGMMALKGS